MTLVKGVLSEREYLENDDGSHKILMTARSSNHSLMALKKSIREYAWQDGDFFLATYPKNGTHLFWEVMQMLLDNSAEYIQYSKVLLMVDFTKVSEDSEHIPSPRVINSHYRLDVLPKQFRGRKSVLAIRNPKDAVISYYYFGKQIHERRMGLLKLDVPFLSFEEYVNRFFGDAPVDELEYGGYFTYYEYMWNLAKDNENFLIVMFEDFLKKPKETVQKIDKFMGTNRNEELIDEIVDAATFDKMSEVKKHITPPPLTHANEFAAEMLDKPEVTLQVKAAVVEIFRKGKVGDWKCHFTVAMNEHIDKFLSEWPLASEIPFVYE